MAAITVTKANVRPVNANQCIIRQLVSGEAIDVGEIVYVKSDGLAWLAAGGTAAPARVIGIVVAIGSQGQVTGVGAGEELSVVMFGPVAGASSMTPGAPAYVSNTAGGLDTAAGTVSAVVGLSLSADILFIHPGFQIPA